MTAKHLNAIGLALGILGTVIVYFYGAPQPTFERGIALGADGPEVEMHDQLVAADERRHLLVSRLGLIAIGLGFAVQIVANYKSERD